MKKRVLNFCLLGLLWSGTASSAPLTLDEAVQRALEHDPRIAEREKLVDAARAIIDEALGHRGLMISANAFIGMTTAKDGNIFEPGSNNLRRDAYDVDGLSDWEMLQFQIIKPLYTFGKIDNYARAAQGQADVKRGDLRLRRGQTMLEVKRAYFGYLTARDVRLMLEDVEKRVLGAQDMVKQWLASGDADATQADLFQLQAGEAQLRKFILQARAVEATAAQGLHLLTGLPGTEPLEIADAHIAPVSVTLADSKGLAQLQQLALQSRPESAQLEAGLRARRSLVAAKRSEAYPDVYAGVVGVVSYASQREDLKNPFLYDPFHQYGATPVLGVRWNWQGAVNSAQVANAQAELNALEEKSSFAQQGIPFEVAEAYNNFKALGETVGALNKGSDAARRWMIASYADFEAGVGEGEKVMRALQTYALNRADYLRAVNDYNMAAARLDLVTGQYP
ncbi:TolC family protein [Thermithiobacillus plumbiphilus]|uniref:TolC family protein n=1 Tax=Thermithiobacillus plumbiphilus TaxID=1729899 RepID=A0ABU9D5Y5_9PROT